MRAVATASEINGWSRICRRFCRRRLSRRRTTRLVNHHPKVSMVTLCSRLLDKFELFMAFGIMPLTNELAVVSIHIEFKFFPIAFKSWKFLFAVVAIALLEFHYATSILHTQVLITSRTDSYVSASCALVNPTLVLLARVTLVDFDDAVFFARTAAFPTILSFSCLCLPLHE